ncbi:polyprenyl synthetase family protein [Microlunatus soli]|uniref:Heptaprenyl diphosphate synthase n=1 Tax=Microlunatus soli TaxID=630515 RepID=A0A1H1W4P0_9ACTN|nr:polyprenyl synthetase family protein [Microlunatus soli]SDS91169.1 heptaprenyl diphosphate synthase [Microlunatus soli]
MAANAASVSNVDIADFEAVVRAQMERIEAELLTAVEADNEVLSEAAKHIIEAGGKRFRPHLVVLGSKFGPLQDRAAEGRVATGAIVVELTHVASLYHDDVMDDATVRRGSQSANVRWGNSLAILVGDYLFARASDLLTDLGMDVVRTYADMFNRLVRGQIAETVGPADGVDPLDHYLQVLADKTASLIATSTRVGAMVAGADVPTQDLLADYGEQLGLVFQLSDDIIDITSDETGKTPGTDLREGVDTLPILLAKRSTDPADSRLLELLGPVGPAADGGKRERTEDEVAEALDLLRKHPAIAEARADVERRAEAARRILDPLPDGPAKAALADLCDSVVTRTS